MIPNDERSLVAFVLVMARLSGVFLVAPFLSSKNFPVRVKALLVAILSALLVPLVKVVPDAAFDWILVPRVAFEVLIGLVIGFILASVVLAASTAGQIIDFQLGFALAQVIDPVQGTSTTVISRVYYLLATLVFLMSGGQFLLVKMTVGSFSILPAGSMALPGVISLAALKTFTDIMLMAVRIGAPIIGALFVADVVFGIVSRGVPQLNVFVIGFPVKILLGLLAVAVTLPLTAQLLQDLFVNLESYLARVF